MKLSVIIVNYNVKDYLYQCLDSVARAIEDVDAEVYVVDNRSSDGSVEFLQARFADTRFHFISNKRNLGFSKANNIAIRQSHGEYVVLLNPDTIVSEDTFTNVIAFLDSHPEGGSAGVRMLRTDGSFALESRRGTPTPWTSLCKMSGLCMLFPKSRLFGHYYMQYLDQDSPQPIEIVSGACMFLRRTVLDQVGILDDEFFMYGEDIDLSYRILTAGHTNYYIPATILHYKGESTNKASFRYVNTFYKAMLIFFRKHYGHYNFFYSLGIRIAITLRGIMAYLTQKARHTFIPHRTDLQIMQSKSYLFVTTAAHAGAIHAIADKHGLRHAISFTLPTEPKDDYDYVVFDVDIYSYRNILEYFRHPGSERKRPTIGTWHARENMLVTPLYIFR